MKHLLKHWDAAVRKIEGSRLVLFLDFDGTLAPIAETPERAAMSDVNRELLRQLVGPGGCTVAIVSGRTVRDVKSKVDLEGLIYVGNHGVEVEWPGAASEGPCEATTSPRQDALREELVARLGGIPGALLEDKETSVAVHYRLVDKQDRARVSTLVREAVRTLAREEDVRITEGKMVLELRQAGGPDKGSAVTALLEREKGRLPNGRVYPVYVGDDLTDEDAFGVLRDKGLTVIVGPRGDSLAEYYLADTAEVSALLRLLVTRCTEGR